MVMLLPKTIRLDGSDPQIFPRAAEPGEWAVSGAFAFADMDPVAVTGKARQAFANGFLGLPSFGRSTLVMVSAIDTAAYEDVIATLAQHFVTEYGAPDLEVAEPVAREEVDFAAGLCQGQAINTLLAVERDWTEDGMAERFRIIDRGAALDHARIWDIVPDTE